MKATATWTVFKWKHNFSHIWNRWNGVSWSAA